MLGSRIRQARKIAGLTQEQLAEKADINRVTVAVLESGKNAPSAETLWRIAQATGQTVDWFHDGTAEEMAPPPAPAAQPPPQPDTHALLAQLVAAQVRTEAAMAALAHAQMESRAEAARTSARLARGRWGDPGWPSYRCARRYP